MHPDHYASHLSAAELDRRDRVAADVRGAVAASERCLHIAQREVGETVPDSPVCGPLEDFRNAVEEARARLMVELYAIEGGRYVPSETNPGVAAMNSLYKAVGGR